jgi:hypothetical protein
MFDLFRRRRRLPAERRPHLEPGERVVAWAAAPGDAAVVATPAGLWLPGRETRLGWHEIHKATWSGRALTLVPAERVGEVSDAPVPYLVMADAAPVTVTLLDPGDLPHQVRARVTRSVGYSTHHPLPDGGVRVVARRVPGHDGVSYAVRYDPGTDTGSPAVRAATDELVEQAQTTLGV